MLTFWPGELNSHAPATDLLLKLSQNDAESGGDAMKHRFGDLQSVTHGQSSIGPAFHQREPAVSPVYAWWPWPSFSHALRIASFILLMCAAVSGSVVANTS